jgi:hypothetical protein
MVEKVIAVLVTARLRAAGIVVRTVRFGVL